MTSRKLLLILTLLVTSAPAVPTAAVAQKGTTCTWEFDVDASPGLSTQPTSGTVVTNGETGTANCNGPVNGNKPTGQGTSGYDGRYGTKDGDTCQWGGEGAGIFSITIPTSAGPQRVSDSDNTYEYGGFRAGSPFSGSFKGGRMSGTFDVQPLDGDCASKPVTKFRVKGKINLR
jgi:hypothetical protein